MRSFLKNDILEIINTLYEAHGIIKNIHENQNYDNAIAVLQDCQEAAIQLGTTIQETEGEDIVTISHLEAYCEDVYQVAVNLSYLNSSNLKETLDKSLQKIENSIKNDIKVRKEIVFCPYKAAMWDSLESVWKAANDDPDCDAYVVAIPYYERNPDQSMGTFHYEGHEYPDYVPITHYEAYDFESRRPDAIYIHNPYDGINLVTSVDPRFYTTELKKYTDELIYIPYFVLAEPDPDNPADVEAIAHFVLTPGVVRSDKVIVQSEAMRKVYIKVLLDYYGNTEEHRIFFENKISGAGSPKFDKITQMAYENIHIPEEWRSFIEKPDGSKKKVIFYNTGISGLLHNPSTWLRKIADTLNVFQQNKDVVLLWRPHPLIESTLSSMCPQFYNDFLQLKEKYIREGFGILDLSADMNRAIAISTAYYGDPSSVTRLFEQQGKPYLLQVQELLNYASSEPEILNPELGSIHEDDNFIWFTAYNFNGLFRMSKNTLKKEFIGAFPGEKKSTKRLYTTITEHDGKLYFAPFRAKEIGVYNKNTGEFSKISYNVSDDDKLFPSANANYISALKHKDSIYFFPFQRKTVLKYDLTAQKLSKISDWTAPLLSTDSTANGLYTKVTTDGKIIIAPIFGTNTVQMIDPENDRTELYIIGEASDRFSDARIIGNKCYLSPLCGNAIIEWDLKLKTITHSIPLPNTDEGSVRFSAMAKLDNTLYFFPLCYDMIVHIDLDSGEPTAATDNVLNDHFDFESQNAYSKEYCSIRADNSLIYSYITHATLCECDDYIYSYNTNELIKITDNSVWCEQILLDLSEESMNTLKGYINDCLKERLSDNSNNFCEDSFMNLMHYIKTVNR